MVLPGGVPLSCPLESLSAAAGKHGEWLGPRSDPDITLARRWHRPPVDAMHHRFPFGLGKLVDHFVNHWFDVATPAEILLVHVVGPLPE